MARDGGSRRRQREGRAGGRGKERARRDGNRHLPRGVHDQPAGKRRYSRQGRGQREEHGRQPAGRRRALPRAAGSASAPVSDARLHVDAGARPAAHGRYSGRRYGSGQDAAGHHAAAVGKAPRRPERGLHRRCADVAGVQLDGGNREIRARAALRGGRGHAGPARADDCAAQRRKPRCGRLSDELSADPPRHRPALQGAVPLRDSRRGAVYQKRDERRRGRGQAAQGADTSGADRHADGEPSGRAVVDLRFRAAGLPQFVRAVHASLWHGRGGRRAAQPHPAVPAAPPEGRRAARAAGEGGNHAHGGYDRGAAPRLSGQPAAPAPAGRGYVQ